jgi:hypothetical protein
MGPVIPDRRQPVGSRRLNVSTTCVDGGSAPVERSGSKLFRPTVTRATDLRKEGDDPPQSGESPESPLEPARSPGRTVQKRVDAKHRTE